MAHQHLEHTRGLFRVFVVCLLTPGTRNDRRIPAGGVLLCCVWQILKSTKPPTLFSVADLRNLRTALLFHRWNLRLCTCVLPCPRIQSIRYFLLHCLETASIVNDEVAAYVVPYLLSLYSASSQITVGIRSVVLAWSAGSTTRLRGNARCAERLWTSSCPLGKWTRCDTYDWSIAMYLTKAEVAGRSGGKI